MIPFMFVIDGIPLPENHNYDTVGGAKIHVWVMDDNITSARDKALSMVEHYLWNVKGIEYEFEISQSQIPHLHEAEALLYQKALHHGIAADFLAYPKIDGNPDDPIVLGRP